MPKLVLILIAATAVETASIARADDTPTPQSIAAVGGGVKNPWRSPYKTALVESKETPLP